mgnify:CR=1 FL=1
MAVTFSLTMVVSMKMFNTTVSSVKNKERQYNKLSEIDRFVRAGEYFTIDEDTLNDRLAAGYMNGINDKYAVYYTAKEYSEKQSVEKGTLTGIGVAVVNDTSSGYAASSACMTTRLPQRPGCRSAASSPLSTMSRRATSPPLHA